MPVAKFKASNTTDVMKPSERNDSLDTYSWPNGKEPLLSLSRAGDSPVQLFQFLQALDQRDLQGWSSHPHMKPQMQKCDKCSREFFSSINHRRHIRVHHRLKSLDKDSTKNRDLLGAFWDLLSEVEAKEILSFKDVLLEEVPGSSVVKSLSELIQRPGNLPQYYVRAGSVLLDIIQARPSRFPMSSVQLFSILDDASEKTFMCGTAVSMQKYVFNGEAGKIGLETRNLVACTSFLVEQKLVKAWLADKDAKALRCQKLLVEEEEAIQRRQAELLERKRQKKLRQKGQKAKEHRQEEADVTELSDTLEAMPSAEQSNFVAASESDAHCVETLPDHVPSPLEPIQLLNTDENVDLEVQRGSGGGTGEQKTAEGNCHRHIVVAQWHASRKSHWNHPPNGFHASQNSLAPKISTSQKHATHRDLKPLSVVNRNRKWSRKQKPEYNGRSERTRVHAEATSRLDHNKKHEVLIGSISVTLGNCSNCENNNFDATRDDCVIKHQMSKKNNAQEKHSRPDSVQGGGSGSAVKLWRPVSRNGTKLPMSVENGTRESQADVIARKVGGQIMPSDNCIRSCVMDNDDERTRNSTPRKEDSLQKGSFHFSNQAAKTYLEERWKEAIASEHAILVLSPNLEPPGCAEVQNGYQGATDESGDGKKRSVLDNAENQMVNAGAHEPSTNGVGKAKLRAKTERGVKLKYIPKQRITT